MNAEKVLRPKEMHKELKPDISCEKGVELLCRAATQGTAQERPSALAGHFDLNQLERCISPTKHLPLVENLELSCRNSAKTPKQPQACTQTHPFRTDQRILSPKLLGHVSTF